MSFYRVIICNYMDILFQEYQEVMVDIKNEMINCPPPDVPA